MREFDHLGAGAGSAGCVVVARRSKNPSVSVLRIEAGGEDGPFVTMPAGTSLLMSSEKDWTYRSEPDPTIAGRVVQRAGGKVLSGSSVTSGMVYMRGERRNYREWVDAGAENWSFDENIIFSMQAEGHLAWPEASHGTAGPLQDSSSPFYSLASIFLAGCGRLGVAPMAPNEDHCDGDQLGAFRTLSTSGHGALSSMDGAFLAPVRYRSNLTVVTHALVDPVLITGRVSTGIRALVRNTPTEALAKREIITSAGTIDSTAVLTPSGIGPHSTLVEVGVSVGQVLPRVGLDLQGQPGNAISRLIDRPTYYSPLGPLDAGKSLLRRSVAIKLDMRLSVSRSAFRLRRRRRSARRILRRSSYSV